MLDGKEVPCFKSNELIKVHQTVKEDANLSIVSLQLLKLKMTLLRWLYHIIHLAEQINEENWLMVKILKSVNLLLVEVFHLMRSYYVVIIKIYYSEPVSQTSQGCFVLFAKHKPHEIFITHLILYL